MDSVGALYFAQARRYDAGVGRFISEDFIKGYIAAPYTMNHYGYCWNRPLDLVDLNGMWPKWIETVAKVATVTVAVVAVGAVFVGTGGIAAGIIAGAAVGGVLSGVANEKNGGSYINGWVGGAIAGGIQAIAGRNSPIGTIIGGAANGLGSVVTDMMDNFDPWSKKKKSAEEIGGDAVKASLKGMAYSIPGGYMQAATQNSTVAETLMVGYTEGFKEGINQFYGAIDNGLMALDSTNNLWSWQKEKGKEDVKE